MPQVIPAILEKDFSEIERKIRLVEGLVDWVQIDLADNTLVPNTTFSDPKPFFSLQTPLHLELHLMVRNPLKYLKSFAQVGFKRFYAHVEGEYLEEFIRECSRLKLEAGLAIDGQTPLTKLFPHLKSAEAVLVMAIKAGFSGQPFLPETPERIRKIREIDKNIPICVDGAMNKENAQKVIAAGANIICSNSYIFHSVDVKAAIEKLGSVDSSVIVS